MPALALIEYCHEREILYLDACIEPWPGGYTNIHISPSERSNYGFREQALALRQKLGSGTTAVLCHGANPGLISHWVKRALLNIAHDIEGITTVPRTQDEWGQLAQKLDIKIMQCAERDTQIARPFITPTTPPMPPCCRSTNSAEAISGCRTMYAC
ncbi:hypothetical protein FBQ90_01635 [Betaproteobacteria bacterium PRO5]|nr:hypothetical protein [Betaproteobacteria bacterium PRO5]